MSAVLTVMRHSVSVLHGCADDGADTRRHADQLHEARTAVAELIGAAKDAKSALHQCIDALSSDEKDDHAALARLTAALISVGASTP